MTAYHAGQEVEIKLIFEGNGKEFWRKAKIVGQCAYSTAEGSGGYGYQVQFLDGSHGIVVEQYIRDVSQDDEFGLAIEAIAPLKFDVWAKLLVGAEARAQVAERRADEAESRLADLMNQKEMTMTKEQAREALDKARDERDAARDRHTKSPTDLSFLTLKEAQKKYIAARDYYTSKFPRHV